MEMSSSAGDYGINHPTTERTAICDYFLAGKYLSKSGFNATIQSYPTVAIAHTKCESPEVLFDQMCRMIFNDELREIITPEQLLCYSGAKEYPNRREKAYTT